MNFAWLIVLWQIGPCGGEIVEKMSAERCQVTLTRVEVLIKQADIRGMPASHSGGCYPLDEPPPGAVS